MPTETCNRVLVERYLLGEGGTEENRATRLHIDACPQCRGHMAGLENDRRDFLTAHPFRDLAAAHPEAARGAGARPAGKSAFGPRWLPALAGLAVCLALAPVALKLQQRGAGAEADGIRTKGGTLLEFYVKRGVEVGPGLASDSFRAGDELQFVYAAGSHAYVTLASIDSRGRVSLYRGGVESDPLSQSALPGEKQPLPFGVTLDDSPGSELFVVIFGSGPLAGGAVESWLTEAFTRASGDLDGLAARLASPPGPPGSEIKTLLLRKTQA